MDTPVLFDTHASVKRLITAGLTESIAEALVEEQQKWHNTNLANLATKQDVALLRQEVKQDAELLRQEVKQDVESLRQEVKQDVESLRQEMTYQFARVDDRIEATRQEVKIRTDSLTDQIANLKWLIGLMFGVLLAFNGFMLAIIKFL